MVQALRSCRRASCSLCHNPQSGICYASKIDKLEAGIDWNQPAEVDRARRVRAFNPQSGGAHQPER
jgi:methionyl-tRNA formyltransferase